VFVIWEPVLATDLTAPSTVTLRRIHDSRVKQYWDANRVLSHAMERDRPSVVWDYIAVYKPETNLDRRAASTRIHGPPSRAFHRGYAEGIGDYLFRSEKLIAGRAPRCLFVRIDEKCWSINARKPTANVWSRKSGATRKST
jgi:hypothetical protein